LAARRESKPNVSDTKSPFVASKPRGDDTKRPPDETKRASAPPINQQPLPAQAVGVAASDAAANARDEAVRLALHEGPLTFDQLLSKFHPLERWLTNQEARAALSRTLTRLKLKTREVRDSGETWMLTA
jgi:hypothetical protein